MNASDKGACSIATFHSEGVYALFIKVPKSKGMTMVRLLVQIWVFVEGRISLCSSLDWCDSWTYSTAIIIAAHNGAIAVDSAVIHLVAGMTSIIDVVGWREGAAEGTARAADILLVLGRKWLELWYIARRWGMLTTMLTGAVGAAVAGIVEQMVDQVVEQVVYFIIEISMSNLGGVLVHYTDE